MAILFLSALTAQGQSVEAPGWRTINADSLFTFRLPRDFTKTDMMGVENYLGEYYKGRTRFLFIWGDTASYEYDEHLMRGLREIETTIDGKRATIRTFWVVRSGARRYVSELNVGDWRAGRVRLYMSLESKNQADVALAKQIFKSIRFSKPTRT